MFQYMCTIFRENIMPVLNNLVLLRNCSLYASLSVAASSLPFIVRKRLSFTYWFLRINIMFSPKMAHTCNETF